MRLPPISAPDFAVTAICRRQPPGSEAGSGEWTCTLVWQGHDRRTLRDTYNLYVNTDGCYSATVSGEGLGGPVVQASNSGCLAGVRNPHGGLLAQTSLTPGARDLPCVAAWRLPKNAFGR